MYDIQHRFSNYQLVNGGMRSSYLRGVFLTALGHGCQLQLVSHDIVCHFDRKFNNQL